MYLQMTGLLALDRLKESFKVAAVAAIANILRDLTLIPMMGLFVGACRLVVPLFSIWLTLVPVAAGAVIYGVVLLRLDRGIHRTSGDGCADGCAVAAVVVGGIRSCVCV